MAKIQLNMALCVNKKMSPDTNLIKNSINSMALAMECRALNDEELNTLIDYVLYNGDLSNASGKSGLSSLENRLITERELRKLLMQHSRTRIARINGKSEFEFTNPYSKDLCDSFEQALYGRPVKLMGGEKAESW